MVNIHKTLPYNSATIFSLIANVSQGYKGPFFKLIPMLLVDPQYPQRESYNRLAKLERHIEYYSNVFTLAMQQQSQE